jgi:hypothetical protein
MGIARNGARTFLSILAKACKLSHLPGFRAGLTGILGAEDATAFFTVWLPLCQFVDLLIGLDDWYNKKDATSPSDTGGEDI